MHPQYLWSISYVAFNVGWLLFLSFGFLSVFDVVFDSEISDREMFLLSLLLACVLSIGSIIVNHW